jgi:D-alanine--poly(phosphoribitol) ligase subunit 2
MDRERALRIVYDTIDIVNQQLPAAKRLRKSPETVILGTGGSLDSLGIITFVIALEEKVGETFGTSIQLLDEQMLVEDSPFHQVGSLADYITTRVERPT